jgi:hypothetical protein
MATQKRESKGVSVGTNPLPISFKDFAKEPVKGLMFICLIAVGYLYIDGKVNYSNQIEKQGEKIEVLENKVDLLTDQLRRSDSALSSAVSKITTLQQLGKIK